MIGKLERNFIFFHNANPQVYQTLVHYAFEWHNRGRGKCGMKLLYERVRWHFGIQTSGDSDFKLNNNYTAFYARMIWEDYPELRSIFRFRRQKIPSSFGPPDAGLPPGGHIS
jgi:hypothetical protein